MEFIWDIPEGDFYKINVHYETVEVPSEKGNTIAIGSLIRGPDGKKIW